jgi:hypothetical protein
MSEPTDRWTVVVGMLVMLLVPTAIVLGALGGTSGPDGSDAPRAAVLTVGQTPTSPEAAPPTNQEPTLDTSRRADSHLVMLEQMRVNVTPQMIQAMYAAPLVQSDAELAELERQATDIDRMLARDP